MIPLRPVFTSFLYPLCPSFTPSTISTVGGTILLRYRVFSCAFSGYSVVAFCALA
jgi:hypothetical protein